MVDDIAPIEVRIRKLAQLFNSFDPSPFHERDLDRDAEEYIVGWAREIPPKVHLKIIIHLPQDAADEARRSGLKGALASYFDARAVVAQHELNELFRVGRRFLLIGSCALVACILSSQVVRGALGNGPIATTISESLIFLGWVANWKPIEIFLYDWLPIRRRRDLFQRLANATIELKSTPEV